MNFFRTLNERDERKCRLEKVGKIDYDILIGIALDVMDAEYQYRKNVRGYYFGKTVDSDKYDMYCRSWYKGYMFSDLCTMIGVDAAAVYNAARIYNRYFERGGQGCPDCERLVRSQM